MNVVDAYKDWSRRNATEQAPGSVQPRQRPTTADAHPPVPAPPVTHASPTDNMVISGSPGPKTPRQAYPSDSSLPTLNRGIVHPFQPASGSEYGTTDDEYHLLNKDDIPQLPSNQKPGGWPKQASNVRWISEDERPTLVTSGLASTTPTATSPKSSTSSQPSSPFARFLSRPAKERKQSPIDIETQMALVNKSQTTLGPKNQVAESEDKPKRQLRTVLGQSGGPVAILGFGGSM
ncbi:hypothetical protein M413DRAFT_401390 [Hebeloma cylindrosporum]|uniref:Uncharacterized protein n=1 Tax=Hebeloma cylindrosporum TaxID=76867 RepID=A0A0C2YQM4_HEBCY|nr:hypothetical protein M413DRAFT_401390 [Hebeloma cylindrosporum h7]